MELDFLSDTEDTSTPDEASALRDFVQAYNTTSALAAEETARRLMSLNEDRVPCDGVFDKGQRIAWLLWDVGIYMPQHQVAVLVVIDAVMALPRLDATPEQETRFAGKLERWRKMEDFWDIWNDTYESMYSSAHSHCLLTNKSGPDTGSIGILPIGLIVAMDFPATSGLMHSWPITL